MINIVLYFRENTMEIKHKKPDEYSGLYFEGHLKIIDPETKEVFLDKRNAIHYENISVAAAQSLSNQSRGWIYQMAFGNGGTIVDNTGMIGYLTSNTIGINTGLYNQTFAKVVDQNSPENTDPLRNRMEIRHISGATYTDIIVTALLDYGEPAGQDAFDNSKTMDGSYIFDEIGLKSYDPSGNGKLLTHVIFHPIQKSLNRTLEIVYVVRVQSLAGIIEE